MPAKNSYKNDLKGKRFGKLLVVEWSHNAIPGGARWRCVCDCGKNVVVGNRDLICGQSASCGCSHIKPWNVSAHKMGLGKHPLFSRWKSMMHRCFNPKNKFYYCYGGRGITVSEEWKRFEIFFNDMNPTFKQELMLERRDNDGPYSRDNCYWADAFVQANNTRRNHLVKVDGVTKTIAQWALVVGISNYTISRRLGMGWKDRDAVLKPLVNR